MHALMRISTKDRLVEAVAHELFDPQDVESTTLPVVLDDRPFTGKLESDLNYDFGQTDDLIPICVFLFGLIDDERENRHFWESVADAYLDGRLSPYGNLLYQFGHGGLEFATREEVTANVERLYEHTSIKCEVDVFNEPIYFLNTVANDMNSSSLCTEPEFMDELYEDFMRYARDHLAQKERITILWNRTPRFARDSLSEHAYSAEYAAVVDHAYYYPDESDQTFYRPVYSNPYKGGGFSCIN